jgi:hypothetical protein
MENELIKLSKLIQFIDDLDDLGRFTGKLDVIAVTFGTLRKDRSLASDIYSIASSQTDGLGVVAISRILIEDYIYLSYLIRNEENRDMLLKDFENHPSVELYLSIIAMHEWGFQFDNTKETETTLLKAKMGFEKHKDSFLRYKTAKIPLNTDDYYRTWTKMCQAPTFPNTTFRYFRDLRIVLA